MSRRKNYKKQGEDKQPMLQGPKLLGQISDSQRVISGVNDVLANPATDEVIYANTHFTVATMGLPDAAGQLIDGALEDVINAYSSSKGYTSSVTPSIIRGHLEQVIRAVSSLLVLKRSQDGKEFTDFLGTDLSPAFFSIPDDGRNWITAYGGVSGQKIDTFNIPVTEVGTSSISNAVWGTDYLAELSKFVLPRKVFDLLVTLYSGVYKNHMAPTVDAYFTLWPQNVIALTANTTPEAEFSSAVSTINSNLTTYPDLRSIIGILGIDASPCLEYDWTRDIKGQTVTVFDDPLFDHLLINEYAAYGGFDEFDVPQDLQDSVQLPFTQGSVAGIEDSFQVAQDMLPYLGLFRDIADNTGFALLHSSFVQADGTITQEPALPSGEITWNSAVTALTATGESRISKFSLSQQNGAVLFPKASILSIFYVVSDNDATSFQVTVSSSKAYSGLNSMLFSEADHTISNRMYYTELMFGVDYRENLNAIARAISANIHVG